MTHVPDDAAPAGRDERDILRRRAATLARQAAPEDSASSMEVLEFRVADQAYAVETRHLAEVLLLRDLTPVPGAPPFIAGITNLRGLATAVLDLHKFLEVPTPGISDLRHLVRVRGLGLDVCVLAASVAGVKRQRLDLLHPAPPGLAGPHPQHVSGMTADGLLVLDVERMLADPRLGEREAPGPEYTTT